MGEFAAAELGARIGRTTYAAAALMADALDLQHRLPRLWARVQTGQVRASYARHVCAKTRDLPAREAGYVDGGVAESADGRIPWTRFEVLVEAKIAQAAPEVTRAKEEQASRARFAKKLRAQGHGMASFMVRADVATIEQIDATVTALAATLDKGEHASDDERRVQAVLQLVTPTRDHDRTGAAITDLTPQVQLYLHGYTGSAGPEGPDSTGVARLEGHGPVTEAWISRVLGPTARFKVTPVLDLAGQAPVDAYEIPDRHLQAVHLMSPADTFPFGSSLSRTQQVDHTIPFDAGGRSEIGNYGPMTITHHRIKTFDRWQVRQPFPGIYLWRDPPRRLLPHRPHRHPPTPRRGLASSSQPLALGDQPSSQRCTTPCEVALRRGVLLFALGRLDPDRVVAEAGQVVRRGAHVEHPDVARQLEAVCDQLGRDQRAQPEGVLVEIHPGVQTAGLLEGRPVVCGRAQRVEWPRRGREEAVGVVVGAGDPVTFHDLVSAARPEAERVRRVSGPILGEPVDHRPLVHAEAAEVCRALGSGHEKRVSAGDQVASSIDLRGGNGLRPAVEHDAVPRRPAA